MSYDNQKPCPPPQAWRGYVAAAVVSVPVWSVVAVGLWSWLR